MTINEFCRTMRRQQGKRLMQLGGALNMSASALSRFEVGKTTPPITVVENILDELGYKLLPIPKELIKNIE